jgi:excisionase family DNA binding protein
MIRPPAIYQPVEQQPSSDLATQPALHELLTVDDVAVLLKVSKSWVYEHTRAGGAPRDERLPHIRIGKYLRFDPQAVRVFLARKTKSF